MARTTNPSLENTNNSYLLSATNTPKNIKASAYTVSAPTGALNGMHYSTTGVGGTVSPLSITFHSSYTDILQGPSGIPEVPISGIPSPPSSPALYAERARIGGLATAAHTITEECERLFCGDLRAIFLSEREILPNPSVIGASYYGQSVRHERKNAAGYLTPDEENTVDTRARNLVREWVEMYDYVGGTCFRGFAAISLLDEAKSMFVFFDACAVGRELKQGLMALIELAMTPKFDCRDLIICLDRMIAPTEVNALVRSLRWVGFAPVTLAPWTGCMDRISNRWLFLGMEV